MTFEQLIYFSEVYQHKSINSASIFLNISQQSLSSSIKALENEFSTSFFERSHKGVIPTTEGERFYEIAQNFIAEIQTYKSSLSVKNAINSCKVGYFHALSAEASLLYSHLSECFPEIFFDFMPFIYENFFSRELIPDIIFSTLFETDTESSVQLPDNYIISRLFDEKINVKFWISKKHPSLANYKSLDYIRLNTAKFVAPRRMYIENFDTKSLLNTLTPSEKIYYVQSDAFIADFLKKGFLASELCFRDKPMLYPFLENNNDVTLIPAAKFPSLYLVIAYNPTFKDIFVETKQFLIEKYK